ncbi:MAG: T9SS type A sorting domain-containing protein [Bacteroidales bacterium]|nr:T9SS type A sorting domain-containing protein [Bacteroidales bacterium]MDD6140764.1 T9SS type A sorting domain-containing protein [Bacteroidales bacterium]MDD6621205.1 T9SS type A sorting domain-containing protein [Bacteroidales bacterium]MDD6669879.1 T9SS type A sorting domain-containing protein [Bacteroidales bacterium]
MKRLIILAIATVAALLFGVARAAEPNALQVTLKSGEPAIFLFEDSPEISFLAESLQIKTLGAEPATYEIDAVESIDFVDYGSATSLNRSTILVATTPGQIVFRNLPRGSRVCVVALDGRTIVNTTASDSFTLDRGSLSHGIYIVKINNFTTKISI